MKLKKIFSKIWPFLIIILLVLVFFWQFFFKGLIPIPADITVGMYFPWLDYKWGYAVGVPVKNSLLSDVVSQIYPFKVYVVESLKQGVIPLWNPFMFGGYPLLANIQVGLFNPTNLFYLFLPFLTAWGLQTALQPLLAAFFTYLFLRSLSLHKLSSLLGALIFAFSGFMIIWLEWNVHGYAVAFLPLLLYLTNKFYQTGRSLFGALLSLGVSLQIFAGYPQVVIYTVLALLLLVISLFGVWQKRTIFWLFWLVLGITLSSIQLLPTLELFLSSQRRLEALSISQSFLPWQHLISFLAPDFFGNQVTGNFWGKGDYTNTVGYSGLVTLVLASLAFHKIKKSREILFFVLLLFGSLLLALPTPLALFLTNLKFLGQGAMAATRILFLVNFSLASLAAFAYDSLLKEKVSFKSLALAFLPILLLAGIFLKTWGNYRHLISLGPAAQASLLNLKVGLRNLLLPSVLALATMTLLTFARVESRFWEKTALMLLFALAVAELFRFGWKYTPFTERKLVFPKTPILEFLKNNEGFFRVEGGDVVPMNMLMAYGIESFSAYDPMYPLRTAQFLSLVDGGSLASPKLRYGQINTYASPLFDLSNICFALAVKRDRIERPTPQGTSLSWKFKMDKFKPVYEDKSVKVLQNTSCLPRAFLVRRYLVEKDEKEIARWLTNKNFIPRETVILEKEPGMSLKSEEAGSGDKIKKIAYRPNREEIELLAEKPALLFVSESFYPGWEAFVDGKKTEIFRADFAFRAVFVPAGEHRIKFVYNPKSFRWGVGISVVSLLFLILIVSSELPLCKMDFKLYTKLWQPRKKENLPRQRN